MTRVRAHDAESKRIRSDWYVAAMERLVGVVQDISHARDLDTVMQIVRKAARELTGADGATFVLRDDDKCYYAEEDAISPLWKGQRFPMKTCISGWTMLHAKPAVIEDIYCDERIPVDAYRPTFVKSLVMVPIRAENPIGAIGNYWATRHRPTGEEVAILQSLAHVTSVAMENVELYAELRDKLQALEAAHYEMSCFAWAAAHDLKTPLRGIANLSRWIEQDVAAGQHEQVGRHAQILQRRVDRMESLLDAILEYASLERRLEPARDEAVDGRTLVEDVQGLVDLPEGFTLSFAGDFDRISVPRVALQKILCHLIGNAVKHHDRDGGVIEVRVKRKEARDVFTVRDDGPGIPPEYQSRIFEMFKTLKPRDVTEGSGMGLSLIKKILALSGGDITVESGPDRGSVFRFTWPHRSDENRDGGAARTAGRS